MTKLSKRSLDIAHFQRIERGAIRPGDKEMKFETLIQGESSPMAKEMFLKRIERAHAQALEKRDLRDKKIKDKKEKAKNT